MTVARGAQWLALVAVAVVLVALPTASGRGDTLLSTDVGSIPAAVAVGDVTGDGRADVVMTTNHEFSPPGQDLQLWVLAQTPGGSLAAPQSYATAGTVSNELDSVAVGDITGDGLDDVVLGIAEIGVQVFPQLPSGSLGAPTLSSTRNGHLVRLGHLDGDDRLDVAALSVGTEGEYPGSETVSVLLNDGRGRLRTAVEYPARHGGLDDLEVGDVTGDGRDDVVVMSGMLHIPTISVLAQLPEGGFGAPSEYDIDHPLLAGGVGVGDVTGDELADVVVAHGGNRPDSVVAVFAQTPAGSLAAPVFYPSYDIPGAVEVVDFDLDGLDDVVTAHGRWQAIGVYLQQPDGRLAAEELLDSPGPDVLPHGLAVADVNGDGFPDIVIADREHGLVVRYAVGGE